MSGSTSLLIIATLVLHLLCASAQDMLESSTRQSCLNRPKPAGYNVREHVTIGTGNWTTSSISAYITSILLDEVVGVRNTIEITNMIDVWDQIAAGDVHAFMEYWPKSTVAAQEEQYIYQENTVAYGGPVGIIGTAGWYMPRYVLKTVPTALSADFTNPEVAGYFDNTFILGDKYWGGVEQQVINDQGYNLTVKVLDGQERLFDLLAAKYPKQEPLLFFLWRPHPLFSTYDLVRVSLPNNTIYYPSEILGKLISPKLTTSSPEAQYLIQSYTMNTNAMSNILTWVSQGDSTYDAACKWVTENEQIWNNWLRPTDFKEVSFDLQIAMWVLSGACIAATLFYLIVTIIYRNSKVIIASSGVFLISMCIGGMLMFGSVVAFITNTDLGCNLFAWFLAVGFALLFGSLFAKTGRVYLLFSNKSLQLVKYTDRDVGACVGVVLVGELVVLSVMTGLQPAEFKFVTEGTSQFSFCSFHEATGITLLAYNGVIILFGIIISTLVARLRLTLYNEAKYIGWAMYNFALIVIFVVVIFLVTDVIVRFTVLCCCVLFITMVSLSVIFVPKIRLLFSYSEEDLRQMNEEQLQAVIRSYTKKFASSSDQKTSTKKGTSSTNGAGSSYKSTGSTYEEEMTSFASTVKQLTSQIDELKKENKRLKETSTDQYQKMYENIYHENMILKNKIFELEGRLKAAEQQKPSL